mmetsp:Transcript_16011/g.30967  ORF Transcript_16011/g.30967 Transcript_16011/m.30967 type:complete len:218 (+) Transcript_16011:60-713(+)|eukprot:CAMPEP_0171500142 /NCGR_PEP_ID=MMETSP0958-20121227/8821_1 /TAXON_ID=87120 /ORGANISM="Aurantiochytrium limacinum, Strain ATCCMYA-1381" /LENGTH=217 /DNA_ID=CAMNT_0012034779 /DNA_START=58 /DNA_END=711 /DNA_ORIENTATION=-
MVELCAAAPQSLSMGAFSPLKRSRGRCETAFVVPQAWMPQHAAKRPRPDGASFAMHHEARKQGLLEDTQMAMNVGFHTSSPNVDFRQERPQHPWAHAGAHRLQHGQNANSFFQIQIHDQACEQQQQQQQHRSDEFARHHIAQRTHAQFHAQRLAQQCGAPEGMPGVRPKRVQELLKSQQRTAPEPERFVQQQHRRMSPSAASSPSQLRTQTARWTGL